MSTTTPKNTVEEQCEAALVSVINSLNPGLPAFPTAYTPTDLPQSCIAVRITRDSPTGQRRQTASGVWVYDSWLCSITVAIRTDRAIDGNKHQDAKAACLNALTQIEAITASDVSILPLHEIHQCDVESVEIEADDADEADCDITRISATCYAFLRLGVQP